MRYFRKMAGETVYLSPVNQDDAETYVSWYNDQAVSGPLGNYKYMNSLSSERKFIEGLGMESQEYSIIRMEDDKLLGHIGFSAINQINREATLLMLIGEAQERGRGYGTEALRLFIHYGFKTLNLHNIMLTVHADNAQGIACYRKAGFREFGRRRDANYKDGRYVDMIYMEILEDEYDPYRCKRFTMKKASFPGDKKVTELTARPFEAKLIEKYARLLHGAFSFQIPRGTLGEAEEYLTKLSKENWFMSSFEAFWQDDKLIGLYWRKGNEIDKLAVSPSEQGHGYGTGILTHALDKILSSCDEAFLSCMLQNRKGLSFYRSYGMEEAGEAQE